jgi:hypothetical protein
MTLKDEKDEDHCGVHRARGSKAICSFLSVDTKLTFAAINTTNFFDQGFPFIHLQLLTTAVETKTTVRRYSRKGLSVDTHAATSPILRHDGTTTQTKLDGNGDVRISAHLCHATDRRLFIAVGEPHESRQTFV